MTLATPGAEPLSDPSSLERAGQQVIMVAQPPITTTCSAATMPDVQANSGNIYCFHAQLPVLPQLPHHSASLGRRKG